MNDFLKIETEYNVEKIKWKKNNIWPFFKLYISSKLFEKNNTTLQLSESRDNLFLVLKSLFYGFKNYFRKYDYLAFSNVNRRQLIDGKFEERVIEGLLTELDSVLLLENPVPKGHYKKKNIKTKNIVSLSGVLIIHFVIIKCLKLFNPKLLGKEIIDDIKNNFGIDFNTTSLLYKFIAQYYTMQIILKIYKPKSVFLVCAYNYYGYILACKKRNIKVIELQHGLITNKHNAYHVLKDVAPSLYPDYLFSYGTQEKEIFKNSFYINENKVITTGYHFIKKIMRSKTNLSLREKFDGYKKVIAFSGQDFFASEIFSFLEKAAKMDPNILYVYVPRKSNLVTFNKILKIVSTCPKNIIMVDDVNIYQIIKEADIHSTMYSSCAIESLALGVPNILLNIKGHAKKHYEASLDKRYTTIVETPKEFVNQIKSNVEYDSEEIIKNSENMFFMEDVNFNFILQNILIGVK